jgi:long-chain acyl-CoA synthetase
MLALTRGSACILIPNPRDIDSYVNVLLTQRFSTMAGLNTLYNALLNHPKLADVDFSHCVVTGAGGMATQKAVADRWQQTTGLPIIEAYGLTEATCYLTATPVDANEFAGSVGLPLPLTDVSIRNDAGAEVASGEHGEVCARGPQIMAGYWNRPEETEQAMTADGYLRTGDIGWMDEKGYLYISDRKKDMLLVSGFNVFPNEIEGVLATHPGVVESAVVGMPDAHSGEVPIAYVVRRNASFDEAELLAFCRERLTGYKCPKSVVFIDILPKSPVGKVLRRELRSQVSIAT